MVILQKNVSELESDRSDRNDGVSEYTDVNEKVSNYEGNQEVVNNSTKEAKNIKEIEQPGGDEHAKEDQNNDVYPKTPSHSSPQSPQYSKLTIQKLEEETLVEIMHKCMLDEHGNNKGYFTKDDFIYTLIMRPNEGWSEDQAEQTLYALVEECKVVEVEPGKYKARTTT